MNEIFLLTTGFLLCLAGLGLWWAFTDSDSSEPPDMQDRQKGRVNMDIKQIQMQPTYQLTLSLSEAQDLLDVLNKASVLHLDRVANRATAFYFQLHNAGINLREGE